jgi:competence protein ComGC
MLKNISSKFKKIKVKGCDGNKQFCSAEAQLFQMNKEE